MTEQDLIQQEKEFFALRDKIMGEATKRGITMRILGAIAFRTHCPKFKYLEYSLGRVLSDIDFAADGRHSMKISQLFQELGWEENQAIKLFTSGKRMIFYSPNSIHSDVFFEKLEFNHKISFKDRLKIDFPTISLVDLLLEKMQIVKINEKDIIDTLILLREHEVGSGDKETLNIDYLAQLCGNDWGLWKTVTMNLKKTRDYIDHFKALSSDDQDNIKIKIHQLLDRIEREPKSAKWKIRATIGERKRWYREVEELKRFT
jgi:hypothetical protein